MIKLEKTAFGGCIDKDCTEFSDYAIAERCSHDIRLCEKCLLKLYTLLKEKYK